MKYTSSHAGYRSNIIPADNENAAILAAFVPGVLVFSDIIKMFRTN
jgi:hypothetical protein